MRRRKLLGVLAAVLLLAGAALLAPAPRTDRITKEIYDRIKRGMSRAEVEAILGPPGNYKTWRQQLNVIRDNEIWGYWDGMGTKLAWEADEEEITIYFDGWGRPLSKWFLQAVKVDRGPFDNFLWRVERLSGRRFPTKTFSPPGGPNSVRAGPISDPD